MNKSRRPTTTAAREQQAREKGEFAMTRFRVIVGGNVDINHDRYWVKALDKIVEVINRGAASNSLWARVLRAHPYETMLFGAIYDIVGLHRDFRLWNQIAKLVNKVNQLARSLEVIDKEVNGMIQVAQAVMRVCPVTVGHAVVEVHDHVAEVIRIWQAIHSYVDEINTILENHQIPKTTYHNIIVAPV